MSIMDRYYCCYYHYHYYYKCVPTNDKCIKIKGKPTVYIKYPSLFSSALLISFGKYVSFRYKSYNFRRFLRLKEFYILKEKKSFQ